MADRKLSSGASIAVGYAAAKREGEEPKGFSMFNIFPLLTIGLVVYGVLTLALGVTWATDPLFSVAMVSGQDWIVSGGDLFLTGSLVLLFFEIVRATGTGNDTIFNHAFSSGLFVVCLILFLLVNGFGTSTFFLLMMMTLVDFMAGIFITVLAARRDIGVA